PWQSLHRPARLPDRGRSCPGARAAPSESLAQCKFRIRANGWDSTAMSPSIEWARAPRTGEREALALEKSVETEFEPLTGLGSVSVRGWVRGVVMVGFGPVSRLISVGDRCRMRADPGRVARRFGSGLEFDLVAAPGPWCEEQGSCRGRAGRTRVRSGSGSGCGAAICDADPPSVRGLVCVAVM